MDLLSALRPLPRADRVLAAHAPALPQPDQLCGPFAAWVALHAVLDTPPPVLDLARAAGTRCWPHDVPAWRPAGAPLDTSGWDALPAAGSPDESGTDAPGLVAALSAVPGVAVVSAAGGPGAPALLASLADLSDVPVGVVAHVRTGPLGPDPAWDVGHFVVVHAVGPDGVGIADTYRELGAPGQPAGCRVVEHASLVAALTAAPGRGLLLLTAPPHAGVVQRLVGAAGLSPTPWST